MPSGDQSGEKSQTEWSRPRSVPGVSSPTGRTWYVFPSALPTFAAYTMLAPSGVRPRNFSSACNFTRLATSSAGVYAVSRCAFSSFTHSRPASFAFGTGAFFFGGGAFAVGNQPRNPTLPTSSSFDLSTRVISFRPVPSAFISRSRSSFGCDCGSCFGFG